MVVLGDCFLPIFCCAIFFPIITDIWSGSFNHGSTFARDAMVDRWAQMDTDQRG